MKNEPVYTEFTPEMPDIFLGLILDLSRETRPIAKHSDPGAIKDCWNSLLEIGKLVSQKARQAIEVEARLDKCIKHTEWELKNMPEESMTTKLLTTGRMNGYKFAKSFFCKTDAGREFAARREKFNNDLFWTFLTPDDLESIKWTGYNDSNWWIHVVAEEGRMQRKDKRGRVWELEPKTDTVTLLKDADA